MVPGSRIHTTWAPPLGTFQARPTRAHTCPGITWRLCGGLGASVARDLRALRLWHVAEQPAVVRSAVELHRCCARVSRAAALVQQHIYNILTAWPGRVAQAPRAGRSRTPWSCSPCWRLCGGAPGSGTSYSSATKPSELGNRGRLRHGQLSSPWRSGRRFANFQRQRGPAGP